MKCDLNKIQKFDDKIDQISNLKELIQFFMSSNLGRRVR